MGRGGYLCVFPCCSPIIYPMLKHVPHNASTAISLSTVNMAHPSFLRTPHVGFDVLGGPQSLRRGLTAYHLGNPSNILPYSSTILNTFLAKEPLDLSAPHGSSLFFLFLSIKNIAWVPQLNLLIQLGRKCAENFTDPLKECHKRSRHNPCLLLPTVWYICLICMMLF